MTDERTPPPPPDALTRPFWDACRAGRLVVQRCRACGRYEYPPLPLCGGCQRDDLEWVESSGRGVVHSATVVHRPQTPAWKTPYVVAIVAMDEGWHIVTNLVGCGAEEVAVDMPVAVIFCEAGGRCLPLFEPACQ